jgi:pimeloyl-ACP methyl ester carboxylesterase
MQDSARMLAGQGVAALIFDFRGHGLSEGTLDGNQAEDAVDAWNTLKQLPEVDESRMGLVGHSLGALSAIIAAGKVDSPKALVTLSCPPPITNDTYPGLDEDFGRWGRKHSHVVEVPNRGTLPWLSGIPAVAARIWMYATRHYVRIHGKQFVEGMIKANIAEVLGKLNNCAKLFVFCEGDSITPYNKSVLVYEAACEPRERFLSRGKHGTPIARGHLRSQWTSWIAESLLD